jgi:hypothetical protein
MMIASPSKSLAATSAAFGLSTSFWLGTVGSSIDLSTRDHEVRRIGDDVKTLAFP